MKKFEKGKLYYLTIHDHDKERFPYMILGRDVDSGTAAMDVAWLPQPGKYIAMALNNIEPDENGCWDWSAGNFLIENKIIFIAFPENFKIDRYFYGPLV